MKLLNNIIDYTDVIGLLPVVLLSIVVLNLIIFGIVYGSSFRGALQIVGQQIGFFCLLTVLGGLWLHFHLLWNVGFVEISSFSNVVVLNALNFWFIGFLLVIFCFVYCFVIFYIRTGSLQGYEHMVILLLILLGGFVIILSNDFISLYLGVELQSLGLYILAAYKQNSVYATEAGIKYFVFGALASCFLLFGVVIFYGCTGLLNFFDIEIFCVNREINPIFFQGGTVALIFFFSGILFKIGGVHFHVWIPDVYEGVPMVITAFFSIGPKIPIFGVLLKLLYFVYVGVGYDLAYVFFYSGLASIFVGSVSALMQTGVKRLMSYSAISHTGFLLLGYGMGNFEGFISILLYLVIYICLICNIFGILLIYNVRQNYSSVKLITTLKYFYKGNPFLCFGLIVGCFAIAGVPPLSGFFSKLYILYALVANGDVFFALLTVLLSIVGMVYYLRLIRVVVFTKASDKWLLFVPPSAFMTRVVVYSMWFNCFFLFFGSGLFFMVYDTSLHIFYNGV